jgi:hypothetical protein
MGLVSGGFTVQHLAAGETVRRLHPRDGTTRQLRPSGPPLRVTDVDYACPDPIARLSDGSWEWISNLFPERRTL